MKEVITFDTNFIIENKIGIGDIITDIQTQYDIILMNLIVEEIKGKKVRQTLKSYKTIKDKIEKSKEENPWLRIIDTTNINSVTQTQEEKLEKWLIKAFDNNVISIDYKNYLPQIMERCKYKKPPFNDAEDASDKGFKDTILFLNIIDYMKEKEDYEKIYLITADNAFIKNKQSLQKEFFEKTDKELMILSGDKEEIYKQLNIELKDNDNISEHNDCEIFPKDESIDKNYTNKIISLIDNIIYSLDSYKNNNPFIIWGEVQEDDVKFLLDNFITNQEKYSFLEYIEINKVMNINCSQRRIKISDLKELSDLYMKSDEENRKAIVFAITTRLNEFYQELPF